ncbi:hydrogenase, Fe-only, partial [human gut metagenome]
YPDVDISITTRELARMIESAGIYFKHLPDEEFDNPFGESTGAATIFGATGGVMEAALRTAVKLITGAEAPSPEFNDVRGMKNIKEAQYEVGGLNVKVAVASGTKNAGYLMDKIKDGTGDYTFIEIMGCPGGCINGGGQPIQHAVVRNFVDLKERRAKALYESDKNKCEETLARKLRLSRSCMMNSSVSREATRLMKYCTQLMWHVKSTTEAHFKNPKRQK